MNLKNAIVTICTECFDNTNDWYNWRKINESVLPQDIKLPDGNQYKKNIALKTKLHEKWKSEIELSKKGELIEYYIKTWGGIKGNQALALQEYKTSAAKELIEKGVKGIASWSKALVVHDHNKYAIFDARVSCSLNALQIIYETKEKSLYPLLASQNKRIIKANKTLKLISKEPNWKKTNEFTFYKEYLELLNLCANELNTTISTVEMLLFAKAEELIEKAKLI
ncbi:hypothetical protein [Flavobacterium sp. 7A]|uniref:hypothetical protein n=1 Tax=Flavobacterium sp. 7A TaxID=2940571 RepID=UPI0022275D6E|nr:hypothetical protein [Flavobacterium sp. 7A]MCW2120721.1 hypothetical protein [Flavobacterium sp. 7A]